MTQTEAVLALLRSRGSEGLTALDALGIVGTMRLAARISDLRAAGHLITTETVTTPNGARVARYRLTASSITGRLTWDEMREQVREWTEAEKREAWGK
jgi:hypothetical protein